MTPSLNLVTRYSGPGSNKIVGNPGTGGVIQRRARPRPNDCTLPAAASESSARCTVRGLAPSAIASAELDHDSPSARKASTAACCSSTGGASTTTSFARRGASAKPRCRRAHVCQRPKLHAKPPDFDPQPCAMRFIGVLAAEGACDQRAPRHVSGPGFTQRACKREQYRARRERNHRACVTHDITARVHDERLRRQQRFDLLQQKGAFLAARDQARRWRVQDDGCAFDLRGQRRDTCVARGMRGPGERGARRLRPEAPHRDSRNDQLVGGPRRGRERRGVKLGEHTLCLVEAADQEQAPDLEISRMRRIDAVAVRFERRPRRVERLRGKPRSRETSAISASATTHLARATASFGPKASAALRSRALARTKSPSCAIAMPRSASAGASSRKATRFRAPSGSPAARARAAAVISESM